MWQRTATVWMVGGTLLLAAVIAAVVGVAVVLPGAFAARVWAMNPAAAPWFVDHPTLGAAGVMSAGILAGAAGVGLLRGRAWAWWLGVSIFAANGVGDLARLTVGDWVPGVTGMLIVGAFLTLLMRPAVRGYAGVHWPGSRREVAD